MESEERLKNLDMLYQIFAEFPFCRVHRHSGERIGQPAGGDCYRKVDFQQKRSDDGHSHLKAQRRSKGNKQAEGQSPGNGAAVSAPQQFVKERLAPEAVQTASLEVFSH